MAAIEEAPQAVRRFYYACDCNQTQPDRERCSSGHMADGVPTPESQTCPECGDVAEKHYLMVSTASHAWTGFYGARRGHDDDDPKARKAGLACDGAPKEGEV